MPSTAPSSAMPPTTSTATTAASPSATIPVAPAATTITRPASTPPAGQGQPGAKPGPKPPGQRTAGQHPAGPWPAAGRAPQPRAQAAGPPAPNARPRYGQRPGRGPYRLPTQPSEPPFDDERQPPGRFDAATSVTAAAATTRAPAPARAMAAAVVRALVEMMSGIRPVSQTMGWFAPSLRPDVAEVARRIRPERRYSVRSIHVSEPRPGVAEIAAVVNRDERAAALAMRMETVNGRWRVTALRIG